MPPTPPRPFPSLLLALACLSLSGCIPVDKKEKAPRPVGQASSAGASQAPGDASPSASAPRALASQGASISGPQGAHPPGVSGEGGYAPNELGGVPVLEYHRFGPKEERWTRTPANFRRDLEFLANNGYALVPASALAKRRIHLPKGRKPVVLTFDDATNGQLRFLLDAKGQALRDAQGQPKLDPNCAVAIMNEVAAKHPGFGTAGTFYVLPSAFEQPTVIREKFSYLLATGRELGNHTVTHPSLAPLGVPQVEREVGGLIDFVHDQVATAAIETLALPFGISPRQPRAAEAVVAGRSGAKAYRHVGLFLVGANPAPSPHDLAFKPRAIPRIQALDSEFRTWFNRPPGSVAKAQEPWPVYVSDGDAAHVGFPAAAARRLDAKAVPAGATSGPPAAAKPAGDATGSASASPPAPQGAASPAAPMGAASSPPASPQAQPASPAAEAPASAGAWLDHHPGYGPGKLPMGARYRDGHMQVTVRSGDSVEAFAFALVPYTEAYTGPALTAAMRQANGGPRALRIGETLKVPLVRREAPKPQRVPRDKAFEARGVYVTGTTAGSDLLWKVVAKLKAQGGNTVVFDAKDMSGEISYRTQVPLAKAVRAYQGGMITDLPKMIERLHAQGIHTVARFALFHDTKLAMGKPKLALRSKASGRPWLENGRLSWVDPSLPEVRQYQLDLFQELLDAGVDEIQMDYVRFPAQGNTRDIAYAGQKAMPQKHLVITDWVKQAKAFVAPTKALLSADVYGVVAWDQGIDVAITGQKLEDLGPHLDAISPMLYPSHFYGAFDGKAFPPDHPEHFLFHGVQRTAKKMAGSGVSIRPWLQAFPYRIRRYGPAYVEAQLVGNAKANGVGWLLWNAENSYDVGLAGVAAFQKKPKPTPVKPEAAASR